MNHQDRLTIVLAPLSIATSAQTEMLLHLRVGLSCVHGALFHFGRSTLPGH